MSKTRENTIRENNEKINVLIQEIIKNNSEEAIQVDEKGKLTISETYKKVLKLEMEKLIKIYKLEFSNLTYNKNSNFDIEVYNGEHADAMFSNQKLMISSGIKDTFSKLHNGYYQGEKIGYKK